MEDADVRKVFVYNKGKDSDIHSWIESLPQRSHSEFIRKAIRNYINHEQQLSSGNNLTNNNDLEKRLSLVENELKDLKENNFKSEVSREKEERKFVDASHIIKDLGK